MSTIASPISPTARRRAGTPGSPPCARSPSISRGHRDHVLPRRRRTGLSRALRPGRTAGMGVRGRADPVPPQPPRGAGRAGDAGGLRLDRPSGPAPAPLTPEAPVHSHSLDAWRHDHLFLGADHDRNERRTRWVVALTAAMMVAEIAGGLAFGSMALLADGLHMATHAGALGVAALA